ncbi:hypothetical protein FB381_0796 [Nocardioides albertanoniae]|uniref:DUF3352 domain-containing protein n=1 Tax=Nocardioides albertanoniae TaxID=1175486 RepID=A0A543A390_9ACTN|nr:hypothetical protein [Nocardioides albertanoniae]TQL66926.1 hypothetical protein FB381_0796 [Nocardioides albertanoniae]
MLSTRQLFDRSTTWAGRAVRTMRTHPVVTVIVGVVVIALVVVLARAWVTRGGDMDEALRLAPAEATRVSFTDWKGIRESVGADLDADSSPEEVHEMIDKAYSSDLTSTSVLPDSSGLLQQHFGWSPATIDWELFTQSTEGALTIAHLDDMDSDHLAEQLTSMGFEAPKDDPNDGGVWDGTLVPFSTFTDSGVDSETTPQISYIAFLPERDLILASDGRRYLSDQVDKLGDGDLHEPMTAAAGRLGDPLSAFIYDGDYTCREIGLGDSMAADQDQADALVDNAGEINPIAGFAMAAEPGGDVRASMAFENDDQARTNADSRAKLAVGPAPGQGGSFDERFKLGKVAADDEVVTMQLQPKNDTAVLSDLANGPLLFATC